MGQGSSILLFIISCVCPLDCQPMKNSFFISSHCCIARLSHTTTGNLEFLAFILVSTLTVNGDEGSLVPRVPDVSTSPSSTVTITIPNVTSARVTGTATTPSSDDVTLTTVSPTPTSTSTLFQVNSPSLQSNNASPAISPASESWNSQLVVFLWTANTACS